MKWFRSRAADQGSEAVAKPPVPSHGRAASASLGVSPASGESQQLLLQAKALQRKPHRRSAPLRSSANCSYRMVQAAWHKERTASAGQRVPDVGAGPLRPISVPSTQPHLQAVGMSARQSASWLRAGAEIESRRTTWRCSAGRVFRSLRACRCREASVTVEPP
jgi:hypothetical protein